MASTPSQARPPRRGFHSFTFDPKRHLWLMRSPTGRLTLIGCAAFLAFAVLGLINALAGIMLAPQHPPILHLLSDIQVGLISGSLLIGVALIPWGIYRVTQRWWIGLLLAVMCLWFWMAISALMLVGLLGPSSLTWGMQIATTAFAIGCTIGLLSPFALLVVYAVKPSAFAQQTEL